VHTDRPDVADLSELRKFPGEERDRLLIVALRLRKHLVVVADLVTEGVDLSDHIRDERRRVPEVVCRCDPKCVLELGHLKSVLRPAVDVVAKHGCPADRRICEIPVDRHRCVACAQKYAAQLTVLFHREVPHTQWLTPELACISNSIANSRNCIPIMNIRNDSTPCTNSRG